METKINIAEILKDKPEGTKLWTDMFGSVTLYVVTDACDAFQVKHHNKEPWFDKEGKLYKEGVLCIYPSKSMRDWEKFAWEKGDVLVYRNCEEFYYTIFEGFQDDEYTQFKSRYCNNSENRWLQSKVGITDLFTKVSDEEAKRFIKKIEECYNGKLNLDTLEIEKPEFKDGDILYATDRISGIIYINKKPQKNIDICYCYKPIGGSNLHICNLENSYDCTLPSNTIIESKTRFATKEEKLELFKALAKENKAWDSDKKQIVDLKPNVELKPFDKVLVRDSESDNWRANLFGYIDKDEYYHCVYANWVYCIPYAGNESLLGTTKDVEG
jgi:hypothetical protein